MDFIFSPFCGDDGCDDDDESCDESCDDDDEFYDHRFSSL